jgi:thioredoxin 1
MEHVDDRSFEQQVLASGEPYLLDFSAVWCPPCRALEPILEALAAEHKGRLRVGKIDIDSSPEVAARYGVRGAPTVVLFKSGQEAGRRLGLTSKRALLQLIGL